MHGSKCDEIFVLPERRGDLIQSVTRKSLASEGHTGKTTSEKPVPNLDYALKNHKKFSLDNARDYSVGETH